MKNVSERQRRKILTGNLWKVVVSITFPLFCYNILNSFYGLIDSVMVANISSADVSAVSTINQIKNLISSLGSGLAAGGGIIVSRLYGSGDFKESKKFANIVFTLGLILCGFLIIFLMPFANQVLYLCQVPEELITISDSYFRLQLVEQAIIVINCIFIALEKSKGNTRIVFIVNFIIMAVKLSLNSIFIYLLNVKDLVYVELSSIIAQSVMLIIGCFYLFNKNNPFQISFKYLSLKWQYVKRILIISLPLFLGKFVISFGKVSVNAMCKNYGPLTVGALGVSNNICGLITSGTSSFEDSESSIVSQNIGNRNLKRTIKTFLVSLSLCCIWGIGGYICVRFIFQDAIINLFNINQNNTTLEFVTLIKKIFFYDSLTIPALMINSAVLGLLYGYGQTFLSTVNNLLRIFTRIGVLWYLQTFHPEMGSEACGISMGISNITIACFALIFLIIFLIKLKIKGYKGMHLNDPEPQMIEKDGILVRIENEN